MEVKEKGMAVPQGDQTVAKAKTNRLIYIVKHHEHGTTKHNQSQGIRMLLRTLLIFLNIGLAPNISMVLAADAVPAAAALQLVPPLAVGVMPPQTLGQNLNLPRQAAIVGAPYNLTGREREALAKLKDTPLMRYLETDFANWDALRDFHKRNGSTEIYSQTVKIQRPFEEAWKRAFIDGTREQSINMIVKALLTTGIIHRQISVESSEEGTGNPYALIVKIPTDILQPTRVGQYALRVDIVFHSSTPPYDYSFKIESPHAILYRPGEAGSWRELNGDRDFTQTVPEGNTAPLQETFDFRQQWRLVGGLSAHMQEEIRSRRLVGIPQATQAHIIDQTKLICIRNPVLILHNWGIRENRKVFEQFLAPIYQTIGNTNAFQGHIKSFYAVARNDRNDTQRSIPTCLGIRELFPFLMNSSAEAREHFRYIRDHATFPELAAA